MSSYIQNSAFSRRTFLGAAGVSAATIALLASCAPASGGTAPAGSMKQTPAEVPAEYKDRRLVVLWSGFGDTRGEAIQKMATSFNESQEEIYVSVQFQGIYADVQQKFTAAVLAKEVPDIINVGNEWRGLHLSRALAPLDDYLGDAIDEYDEFFLSEGVQDGQTYWVPFARSTPLFYYNKTLFQQAGLPDRAPETWSELREWGKQFTGIKFGDVDSKIYGISGQDGDWQFQAMIRQWGGIDAKGWTPNMNSDEVIEAAEYTRALVHDDKQAYMASAIVQDFQNGVCASATMSTASLRGLLDVVDFELGAAYMPGEKERGFLTGGGGFSLPAGLSEERRADAAAFISYLAEPSQVAEWSALTGYVVANPAAVDEPAFKEALDYSPLFGLAADQMEFVKTSSDMRLWVPGVSTTIFSSLQAIWADGKKPGEVFPELDESLTRSINEFVLRYPDIAESI